jgi:hypothetical protein
MALDDYVEPEVAVAVAVTAAVASPTVRRVVRRGLVYGLAGLMAARDKVAAAASGVAEGTRHVMAPAESAGAERTPVQPAPEGAPS